MLSVTVLFFCLIWSLVLAALDIRHRRLPNWLTLGGVLVAFACRLGYGGLDSLVSGLAAAAVAGGFMLLPFLLRGAGGGDVKMLFAAGAVVGWASVLFLLWYTSLAGLALGIVMIVFGHLDASRLKHLFRVLCDWRYDRKAGALTLPDRENQRVRVPFSIAIGVGLLLTLLKG